MVCSLSIAQMLPRNRPTLAHSIIMDMDIKVSMLHTLWLHNWWLVGWLMWLNGWTDLCATIVRIGLG